MLGKQYFIDNLDKAIEEHWIQVYYQPIVRSTTGKICNEEALSRWIDPVHGMVPPLEFIPALEEAGLVWKLDLYVVEQILEKFRKQKDLDMRIVTNSVNLSRSDFDSCDVPEEIRRRVDEAGFPRNMLALEIAENAVWDNYAFMKKKIECLHEMGFQVWLDDFGNGYHSVNILSGVPFDMLKFDLRFMKQFTYGVPSKAVLTELLKMAINLEIDTICEGVETVEESQFLKEIGCEKLQGYYFSQACSLDEILKTHFQNKNKIGFEEAIESAYYDEIGRVNLYDLAVIANNEEGALGHFYNMLPMAVLEIDEDMVEYVRTNQSYRDFVKKTVNYDLVINGSRFSTKNSLYQSTFLNQVLRCAKNKDRVFISDKTPDNLTIHSFIRWLADNPMTGGSAVVVAVLSVVDAKQEATYENIARALAADYINLFYVDLETEEFIEYSSDTALEELAIERNGTDFFSVARRDAKQMIYEDDFENFVFSFTKDNILHALEKQGTFTLTYRQMIQDRPVRVNMKAMRMQRGDSHIIIGVNIIDEQAKLEEGYERAVIANALSGTEAARLDSMSLDSAAFAVKSCVKLMGSGEFKENVKAVLLDIMEIARAESARVMLVNQEKQEIMIFQEVNKEGCFLNREEQIAALRYEMIAAWEGLIGENNAIVVDNEKTHQMLEEQCPEWAETMKRDGAENVVVVPLRRAENILGYLYVVNFDAKKTEKIRELIELVSFFLSSEISNYLFRQELEILSNFDQLTGLKNRHAMLRRVREIEKLPYICSCGVLTMDLNGLKKTNDTLGHFAGDELIQNSARMLMDEFGREELYRIGGDEFIVIFPEISEEEFLQKIEKFRTGRLPESGISMAIGPVWTNENADMDKVFYNADQKMYADKKAFYAKQGGKH